MVERTVERLLYASRWLLAPVYLGLSLALIALAVKFFVELWHTLAHVMSMGESDVVLSLLALVDLSLVASLIVMVMFSGYENFVSKIDMEGTDDKLGWLGKLDAGTLKLKVAASIVAISSIHLLRKFMEVDTLYGQNADTAGDKLLWYVIIHLTFVVSAVMLGVLDRMTSHAHKGAHDD